MNFLELLFFLIEIIHVVRLHFWEVYSSLVLHVSLVLLVEFRTLARIMRNLSLLFSRQGGRDEACSEFATHEDFDNFRFVIHELFTYAVASLLRHERFSGVANLVRQKARQGDEVMVPFSEFCRLPLRSLIRRNERMKTNRVSIHADLLEQRTQHVGVTIQELLQADHVLYIRDCIDSLRRQSHGRWWPETLVYAGRQHGPFELYARCQSSKLFDEFRVVFDIESREDLLPIGEAFSNQTLRYPSWGIRSAINLDIFGLMNLDKLATRA